jgi:hypothetical protein
MTQAQLSELKSLYYDFVYVRAYHARSPLAAKMEEIDKRFEKLLLQMIAKAPIKEAI